MEKQEDSIALDNMPVIATYSRRQAISDGTLVDVTETAKEAGITFPTVLTQAVWRRYVEVPPSARWQDEEGRLWDVLTMLRYGIMDAKRCGRAAEPTLLFDLLVANDDGTPNRVTLKVHCGPGDSAAPVLTVMLPEED